MSNDRRFAVLIDADNISDKYIKIILDEISNDGLATYKRIYGDWTKATMSPWKKVLLEHSITPIQQYGYTTGKNATDSAMIIDAMDILYSSNVEGFCLVSSDSDFTKLASRLRESGMTVVGMGEKKTPKAFIAACSKFKYLDILLKQEENEESSENNVLQLKDAKPTAKDKETVPADLVQENGAAYQAKRTEDHEGDKQDAEQMTSLETIRKAVITIIKENTEEDEWIFIGDIGNRLSKRYPDFDVRNYGFKKLTPFIRSLGLEIKVTTSGNSNNKLVYVKEKDR